MRCGLRTTKKRWTDKEVNLLETLKRERQSLQAMCEALPGRTHRSIGTKLVAMSDGRSPSRQKWRTEESERMKSLTNSGASFQDVYKAFRDRSRASVCRKYTLMRPRDKTGTPIQKDPRFFTPEDPKRILEYLSQGMSLRAIQERYYPNRSCEALSRLIHRHTMNSPARFEWTENNLSKMIELREIHKMGFTKIALELGCSCSAVMAQYKSRMRGGSVAQDTRHW